jgi:integrase
MRLLLTDRFCARAKADKQVDFFDEKVSGLAFRISPTHRGWTLHYRLGPKQVRWTLGGYPALSLAAARARALEAKTELAQGRDPRLLAKANTFQAVAEDYLRREGPALRSLRPRESVLRRLVFPVVGSIPIADIRRSDIVSLLDGVEEGSGPVQADRTLAIISKIMNWYSSRSDEFRSPIVRGMSRTKPKERARSRILSDEELRALWTAADGAGVFGSLLRFLLLTGARLDEAASMQWTEISGSDWTLPASRNKTKVELIRPLSSLAQSVLPPRNGPWVFSVSGSISIRQAAHYYKEIFDRTHEVSGYNLHDCRRSARSLMSRAGVSSDIAERCLGHVIPGIRSVYDRHQYRDEMLHAYESLASLIQRIVSDDPNVIAIRGSRHA